MIIREDAILSASTW